MRVSFVRDAVRLSPTLQRILFYGSLAVLLGGGCLYSTMMPGRSHTGPLSPESPAVVSAEAELRAHVEALAGAIGERRIGQGDSLAVAREYVASQLRQIAASAGGAVETEQLGAEGSEAENVIFELPGERPELLLIGAHYDSAPDTPGANDNATGVAVGLYLAKSLADQRLGSTLRFVFFANEEPPYFQNPGMGSLAHARGCSERGEPLSAMLALESLGYYSEEAGSQKYPPPLGLLYPERGNFVGFVGNLSSRSLVREAVASFRAHGAFPSEGAALPGWVPGVGWSDHWAFWQFGYPALMVTDTAVFRDPHYHQPSDEPRNLSYGYMARVALGLRQVIIDLSARPSRER